MSHFKLVLPAFLWKNQDPHTAGVHRPRFWTFVVKLL